jgi:hypothetical protein
VIPEQSSQCRVYWYPYDGGLYPPSETRVLVRRRIITGIKFNRLRSYETSFELKPLKLTLRSCCLRSFESFYCHKIRQLGMPPVLLSWSLPSVESSWKFVCTALYRPVTQRLQARFPPPSYMLHSRGTLSQAKSRVKGLSHGFVMTIDTEEYLVGVWYNAGLDYFNLQMEINNV